MKHISFFNISTSVFIFTLILFSCQEKPKGLNSSGEITIELDSLNPDPTTMIIQDSIFSIYDRRRGIFAQGVVKEGASTKLHIYSQHIPKELRFFGINAQKQEFLMYRPKIDIKTNDSNIISVPLPKIDSSRFLMSTFSNYYNRRIQFMNDSILMAYIYYRVKTNSKTELINAFSKVEKVVLYNTKSNSYIHTDKFGYVSDYNIKLEHPLISTNHEKIYLTFPHKKWINVYDVKTNTFEKLHIHSSNIKVAEPDLNKSGLDYNSKYYQSNSMVNNIIPIHNGQYILRFVKCKQEPKDKNGLIQPTYLANHICEYINMDDKKVKKQWLFDGKKYDLIYSFLYNDKLYIKNREKSTSTSLVLDGFDFPIL